MAHFAKLDENDFVIDINVVANEAIDPANEEESGIKFLTDWSNGYDRWVQTSYNAAINGFRKNYAGIGYFYDRNRDAFIAPKPFDSWILDEKTCQWNAPIQKPVGHYAWDEMNQIWIEYDPQS